MVYSGYAANMIIKQENFLDSWDGTYMLSKNLVYGVRILQQLPV